MTAVEYGGRGATAKPFYVAGAEAADLGELWSVQRAAYVDDAQAYGDPFILPLGETPDQVGRAVQGGAVLVKAVEGHRIVGGARGRASGAVGMVARVFVVPDRRRRGIARALLAELEHRLITEIGAGPASLVLSTGHESRTAQALFRVSGYRETHREALMDHLTLLHFRKDVPGAAGTAGAP